MAKRCNAIGLSLLRSVVRHRNPIPCLALSPLLYSPSPASAAAPPPSPLPTPFLNSSPLSSFSRSFSSTPDVPATNIVIIKTGKELSDVYKKAEVLTFLYLEDSLPAIFYFTAEWCGPCRLLWPTMQELSKEIGHVKIYKVDADLDGVGSFLSKLNISSVPTLYFFSNGKKAAEVSGADANRIKKIVSELYRKEA